MSNGIGDEQAVWKLVRLRMRLKDDDLKPLIEMYITEVGLRILHFCNISVIPSALNFVWASMVIDMVRVELPNEGAVEDSKPLGNLISVGDTSVSSNGNSKDVTNTSKSIIDQIVFNYRADLYHYRKMRW